jgi:hypothetical protein
MQMQQSGESKIAKEQFGHGKAHKKECTVQTTFTGKPNFDHTTTTKTTPKRKRAYLLLCPSRWSSWASEAKRAISASSFEPVTIDKGVESNTMISKDGKQGQGTYST